MLKHVKRNEVCNLVIQSIFEVRRLVILRLFESLRKKLTDPRGSHTNYFCLLFYQDLENQMHIAEQRRRTLLKDFHDT